MGQFIKLQTENERKYTNLFLIDFSLLMPFLCFVLFMIACEKIPNNLTWFVAHDCLAGNVEIVEWFSMMENPNKRIYCWFIVRQDAFYSVDVNR